jgi:hypothetical protein
LGIGAGKYFEAKNVRHIAAQISFVIARIAGEEKHWSIDGRRPSSKCIAVVNVAETFVIEGRDVITKRVTSDGKFGPGRTFVFLRLPDHGTCSETLLSF